MAAPAWISPGEIVVGGGAHFIFVDLNAQPGGDRYADIAVVIVKDRAIRQVIEQVRLRIVMKAQALFLDQSIGDYVAKFPNCP